MKKIILLFISINLLILVEPDLNFVKAQESIPWLEDFTADIPVGSSIYTYSFTSIDENNCKIRIEEKKTSKKGKISTTAYAFYLSDIDLTALDFKTSGNNAIVNLNSNQLQKFIGEYSEGELTGYTNKFSVHLSEIDQARAFIEKISSHAKQCEETELVWSNNQEALGWLSQNIGESTAGASSYKQEFSPTDKDYIVQLRTETTDSKGMEKTISYDFNLSDIDPDKINLVISGKDFKIVIPTRENKNYIRLKLDNEEFSYARNLEIYSDEMEHARNIYNALFFVANNTKVPTRKSWNTYAEALNYIKSSIGKVTVSSANIEQSLSYNESASGMVHFSTEKTDTKGNISKTVNSFYLSDLHPEITMDISTRNISFNLEVRDKQKFIRVSDDEGVITYANKVEIFETDIETARELINAFESAINNSDDGAIEFTDTEKSIAWLKENVGEIIIDESKYDQTLNVIPDYENKIEFLSITGIGEGETTSELFMIYPEDLSPDDLEIKITGKKMMVPLSTGKLKYIKSYRNDVMQNYTSSTEVLFDDVQKARNFINAIKTLYDNSYVKNRLMNNKEDALTFIQEHVTKIEVNEKTMEQKIEIRDEDDCKMNFITKITDSKGNLIENLYEFTLADIDPENSQVSVSMDKLIVDLVTKDKEKLIKPYKNGEEENFINNIELQVDDVLIAKKILGAFTTLAKVCE